MFDFKAATVIYATLACASVAAKINTLELRGRAVYGQSFDLVCVTTVIKNTPYATFLKSFTSSIEGKFIGTIVYNISSTSCITEDIPKNYTYSCSNEGMNITLTVPAENEVEHDTFWGCTNEGANSEKNNNVIQVFVNDPVHNATIKNSTLVKVTEGINETFVCETSPCRPSAGIYWMKGGINITNPQANSSIHQSGTKNITTSRLQFTSSRGDNGSLLTCGAYNGYGIIRLSANVTIIVHYAPDGSPSISSYLNSSLFSVIENISYSLNCSITGGNPLASLSWNCFGIVGSGGTVAQTVTSTISLNVDRSKNGEHCQCISSQEIQGSRNVSLAVEVLYYPTVNPFISPVKVIQGKSLEVVCTADGNPSPQLTWNPAGDDKANRSRLYYAEISRDKAVLHNCTATNNMVPTTGNPLPGSDSKAFLIDVLYPPTVNRFTSPVKVIQGQPLEVVCSADGNPPPQLTWNPAGEDGRNKSRLYYSAVSRNKAVIHTCTATNNMVPTNGRQQPMSDSKKLHIDVLYYPTVNPFISPVKVIQGKSLEVVCTADGNPSPQLTWNPAGDDKANRSRLYYAEISRDKAVLHNCTATNNMVPTTGNPLPGSDSKAFLIDVLYPPTVNRFTSPVKVIQGQPLEVVCSADGNPPPQLTWNPAGEDGRNKSRLYYSAVSRNKAVIHTCTATNNMVPTNGRQQPMSDSKKLHIDVLYYPTVNPFISPVKVIQGKSLEVVCTADGNPSPQLTWNPAGDDKANRSRLYYAEISRDKAVLHNCTATNNMVPTTGNPLPGSDSKAFLIDVLYPPTVNRFTSPVKVIQGQPLEVVCSADGNPPPQLTWNPAGEDGRNKSRLYYSAVSRNKAVIHTCTATNNMVPTNGRQQPMSDSKKLHIDVLYYPTVNPFISPVKVIQGKSLEVVCTADGNPSPQLTWNPAGDDKANRSRLYYAEISRDKAVLHNCTATNNMVPTTGNPLPGSDSKAFLIDVLYPPTVNRFTSPVKVIQGQPLEVVCSADGNPPPQLTWNPAGEDGRNKSRLYYSAVSRNKAVIHTCTATNNMVPTNGRQQPMSDSKKLHIDVLYNASISKFTSKENGSVLAEGSRLELQCQVDSNPYSVISLYFENDLKLKLENDRNLSYNTTATCLDAGKYTCTATNLIMNGSAVSRELQINVTCHPRLDHRKNISTEHYGALGDNVTLKVYVIAYPEPTNIKWYHREKEMDMWQTFPNQSPSSSGLFSSIMVHLATESDFGYYLINMSNDYGIYNDTYHIIPTSKPSIPTSFTATVNSPDSVKLEWTPGFWGGHLQDFIIQYRILPDGAWVKLKEIQDSGSTKQTVTITGLQQKTTYEFHLYAENKKGQSDNTSASITTTELPGASFPIGLVAGSFSALVSGICVILVLIFLRRRGQRSKRKGLVDNPVYDSSDPKPSTSSGATGTEYAVVVKKKAVLIENSSNIYAQVHKQEVKKKNGAAKGEHGKTSRGDVYKNPDLLGRSQSMENVYANSESDETKASGDNVYENLGAAASHGPMANKDGLLYADLMLDPPTTKNGKPVIRGIENRTEYAEIAYGKRGKPLPDSDEEKEKNKSGANNYTNE